MELNNLYNFKNPIKHFINIDNVNFPHDIANFSTSNLCWTVPINISIRKFDNTHRTLKMPNMLNFKRALLCYDTMPHFRTIKDVDPIHKRLSANIETGDFSTGEYDNQLEEDFERLSVYDNLIRLDIKDFYNRLYTHNLDFGGLQESFLTNLNAGRTAGLILGNYLSLYFAEMYLGKVSLEIQSKIVESGIECDFSYDFYFYCNEGDNESLVEIFENVLQDHELERNSKIEIWTYGSFNNYNMIARYWKKVMAHCNIRFKSDSENNKMYFVNQIVYRMSQLADEKLRKTFVNNFFKTEYFKDLDLDKFQIKNYDYHQLCFIFKSSPEVLLYTINKFNNMSRFDKSKIEKFLTVRYMESLKHPYHEEQLYYYFALKTLGYDSTLNHASDDAIKSRNQLLISYYLKDDFFNSSQINTLKRFKDEKYWFQNYHLILYVSDMRVNLNISIEEYLIPKKACDTPARPQKATYLNFYERNINSGIALIKEICDVNDEVENYLDLKIHEAREAYESECNDDEDIDFDI